MSSLLLNAIRLGNRVLGPIVPRPAAAVAQNLFTRPRAMTDCSWEAEVKATAEEHRLPTGIHYLEWRPEGEARGTTLCLHGWQGRATQFGVLAKALVDQGQRVISMTGTAHGTTHGRETTPVDFARDLLLMDREQGPFDALVGHSMGAAASVVALSWGLRAEKAALIAGPSSLKSVINRFVDLVMLPEAAREIFVAGVIRQAGLPADEMDLGRLVQSIEIPAMIVHDRNDEEIPFSDAEELLSHWPGAVSHFTVGLGHNKALREPGVIEAITGFVTVQQPEPAEA